MDRAPATCALVLLLWTSLARAGAPVTLPPTEKASDWRASLSLVGMEEGPPGSSTWVVIVAGSPDWVVLVRDDAGEVHRTSIAAPKNQEERDEVLFLADSLLRSQLLPVAPTAPTPPVVAAVKPRPVPKVEAPPEPEPEPEPEPVAVVVAPPPLEATSTWGPSLAVGAMARLGLGAEPAPGLVVALGLADSAGLELRLSLELPTRAGLNLQPEGRRLGETGVHGALGWRLAERLAPTIWMDLGLSRRSYLQDEEVVATPLIPAVGLGFTGTVVRAGQVELCPWVRGSWDLRTTELTDEGGTRTAPHLGFGIGAEARWSPRVATDPRPLGLAEDLGPSGADLGPSGADHGPSGASGETGPESSTQ